MFKSKKGVLRYADQVKRLNLFIGIIWIFAGIAGMFRSVVSSVFLVLALCFSAYFMFSVFFSKNKEEADEMAIAHENKAMSLSFLIMQILLVLFCLVKDAILDPMDLNIDYSRYIVPSIFILMGLMGLLVGVVFHRLEAE